MTPILSQRNPLLEALWFAILARDAVDDYLGARRLCTRAGCKLWQPSVRFLRRIFLKRTSDKVGSMHRKPRKRGPDVWVWRRRVADAMGIERNSSVIIGSLAELPTEKHAWAALLKQQSLVGVRLSNLVERYKAESLDVRHSTRASYLSP
jgi:hypothetical protein